MSGSKSKFDRYYTDRNLALLTVRLKGATLQNCGALGGISRERARQVTVGLQRGMKEELRKGSEHADFIQRWIDENNLLEHFVDVD